MINKFKRQQDKLNMKDLFPQKDKSLCACGCRKKLTGRKRRWYSIACSRKSYITFAIIQGNTQVIREQLYKRDKGKCAKCKRHKSYWEADHIIAVCNGGGGCGLENFQTLCSKCHKFKTKVDIKKKNRRLKRK